MVTKNYFSKFVLVLLGYCCCLSCDGDGFGEYDGQILVKTKGTYLLKDIGDNFFVGEGEILRLGKQLPDEYYIVGSGLIYGEDSSGLQIQSYTYQWNRFPSYVYSAVSSSANVVNIAINDTLMYEDGHIASLGYTTAYDRFLCPLHDLKYGTRYYYRAFAHISEDSSYNKYLYGAIKEFITTGIALDPTVFVSVDVLGIGVMKEDLMDLNWVTGLNAVRACSIFNFDGGVGGYADWRLPTIEELREIYNELRRSKWPHKTHIYCLPRIS